MVNIIGNIGMLLSLLGHNLTACTHSNSHSQIRAVNLSFNLPNVNWDGTISENKKEFDVYYFQNLIMYNFYYTFDSTVNGENLLHEKRNFYFVFHKDSLNGYTYYPNGSNSMMKTKRVEVDSILKSNTLENLKFDTLRYQQPDSISQDIDSNMIKFFSSKPQNGHPESYTLLFFYSKKMTDIPESFSKKMDNVDNRKLFKIQIFSTGGYHEEYKMTFPKTEINWEMRELKDYNKELVLSYFERHIEQFWTK